MIYEELKVGLYVCRTDVHTFGTDAFLLTGFCRYREKDLVCDLGTGCGIIPLLMQRHRPPKQIWAVDIQPDAIEQLRLGIEKSGVRNIEPICADLRELP
ncbi:MAG TPA: methyltransferase, partial [Ruminococcus sp.]|nr:methyltransferase [Ruminococcus sp.]